MGNPDLAFEMLAEARLVFAPTDLGAAWEHLGIPPPHRRGAEAILERLQRDLTALAATG
jgi:hypothetical protein